MSEKPIKTRFVVRHMLGLYGIVGIQARVESEGLLSSKVILEPVGGVERGWPTKEVMAAGRRSHSSF